MDNAVMKVAVTSSWANTAEERKFITDELLPILKRFHELVGAPIRVQIEKASPEESAP